MWSARWEVGVSSFGGESNIIIVPLNRHRSPVGLATSPAVPALRLAHNTATNPMRLAGWASHGTSKSMMSLRVAQPTQRRSSLTRQFPKVTVAAFRSWFTRGTGRVFDAFADSTKQGNRTDSERTVTRPSGGVAHRPKTSAPQVIS